MRSCSSKNDKTDISLDILKKKNIKALLSVDNVFSSFILLEYNYSLTEDSKAPWKSNFAERNGRCSEEGDRGQE